MIKLKGIDYFCTMSRGIKLNERFISAANQVINDDINAVIFTDEDLLEETNDILEDKDRLCLTTFTAYKSNTSDNENIKLFLILIKKARRKQRRNLVNELRTCEKSQWTRFAWILERKFPEEYNLKQEINHNIEPITINLVFDKVPQKSIDINKTTKLQISN